MIPQVLGFESVYYFWLILRYLLVALLGFYVIFSLIVLRQSFLMSHVLVTRLSPVVKVLAFLQALFSLGLFFSGLGAL